MADDLVERARWGDFAGMNLAGIVRMSFELDTAEPAGRETPRRPQTGRDIKGRDEQTDDCRSYSERRGGTYVFTYEEPDTSAWKRRRVRLPDGRVAYRVVRPVFEKALEDLKRGVAPNGERLDALIVYDIDRLTRDNRHLEDAIEVVEHFKRPILDITGTLDLLTDNGRTVARFLVTASNKQSADTARRVARKHRALQREGIPAGGPRPFGWLPDRRTLDAEESEIVRDGVRRILGGAPLAAVVADWRARGSMTPSGKTWGPTAVRHVLRNPRLCGWRARHVQDFNPETGTVNRRVEIVRDDAGKPVQGQWEPILSVEEWEAVTSVLGTNWNPTRGANARKYLLTSILRCDRCEARLRGFRRTRDSEKWVYACRGRNDGGCGGVSINGPQTDEHVIEAVLAKFELEAQERKAGTQPVAWEREDEYRRVQEDMVELKKRRQARKISAERYFDHLASLEEEQKELSADRERWIADTRVVASAPPTMTVEEFHDLPLAQRRAYVDDVLTAVVVKQANGKRGFRPERLDPVWR